jgi:hypothetical protein
LLITGWGQQQQQAPQGWGQQQQAPAQQGWGQQQQQAPQAQGWGQEQQQQGGWGQENSGQKGKKGKGVDWEYNFALGYQGEKGQNKGQGGGGWGQENQAVPAADASGGGWGSEPETNVKKPSLGDIFNTIISFPRQIKDMLRDSGLWILFLPLLVLIPLFLFAFTAGKFFGGMDEGWGWDKRSHGGKTWLEGEWDNLKGFLNDPKVQRAAQGFMDEFVASRIVNSVSPDSKVVSKKSSSKEDKKAKRR